jgi:acetyl esterase/lipase
VAGCAVHTATPKQGRRPLHIIYTHGGSFVNELMGAHWDIVAALVRATGATVTVPQYPLAPEHTHGAAFAMLEAVYRARVGGDPIVLCGDSAGGNLALVQALRYRDLGLPLPARLILFSPWLELTMTNPEIAALQPRDPMLWASELAETGRWWAGDADPTGPLLSPVNAALDGLPQIDIYQGSEDVLAPDARRLRDRSNYHETAGAFHVFMGATFTPEAKAVFRQIGQTL